MTSEQRDEIRYAILFYEAMGWDWGWVVQYLAEKANGCRVEVRVRLVH